MAHELKGLVAGALAGLAVVGASYGVSAIVTHGQPVETPVSPAPSAQGKAAAVPSAQMVATGRSLYTMQCAKCHGAQAQGKVGPTLHHLHDPDAKIARNIANGFPGRMPAYKSKLNDAQIKTLVAYIQSLE